MILPTDTPARFATAVTRAVELLRQGEVVALPTETVYGLAANALDAAAVARIYAVKGRPATNPLIVHVSSVAMARRCVRRWPAVAGRLAAAFWPGPLTLVLPRAERIPAVVTAGGPTVGVRWPNHPLTQAVIQECGFPLAAPSANLSNRLSPTTAAHVQASLGPRIGWIVDGGPAPVGIESTVVDLSVDPPQLLRPGMIHAESLRAVLGRLTAASPETADEEPRRSPGRLPRHYAPNATLVVWRWLNAADLEARIARHGWALAQCHVLTYSSSLPSRDFGGVCRMPREAAAFARAFYAELHRCDARGARIIIVEAPPETADWRALADRLRRAAA